jgi:hypothetical protein
MYLNAKRFLWHNEDELADRVSNAFPELGKARIKEVTAELMYWRKANAIHKWFVDNVQGGLDECQESWVSQEQLEQLLAVIEEIMADNTKAAELLPPQAGFFFGSTDMDDWYWKDLERTRDGLRGLLAKNLKSWSIYYRASW